MPGLRWGPPALLSSMISALNFQSEVLLTSVSLRCPAMTLSCSFIWNKFLCLLLLSVSVLGRSALSPVLEGNGFMKKRSCSALQCSVPCSPGLGTSWSVSIVCFAVVAWPLCPSAQSSAEAPFVCCGQCLDSGLNVVHFN